MEGLDEIYLWVDEHSFSWHDMVLIITELKTGQLLAVLDWITKEKLDHWIWHVVPIKCHQKILWYSTDMCPEQSEEMPLGWIRDMLTV